METKKAFILIFLCIVYVASFGQTEYDKKLSSLYKNTVKTITPSEAQKKIENQEKIILVDSRAREEFEVSHIKGAIFLDYDSYSVDDLKKLPIDQKIIVYCSVGYRSERIGEKLQSLGYKNVYNLYGGIFEWKNEGLSIVNKSGIPTDSVHTYNKSWSKWLTKGIKVY